MFKIHWLSNVRINIIVKQAPKFCFPDKETIYQEKRLSIEIRTWSKLNLVALSLSPFLAPAPPFAARPEIRRSLHIQLHFKLPLLPPRRLQSASFKRLQPELPPSGASLPFSSLVIARVRIDSGEIHRISCAFGVFQWCSDLPHRAVLF